MNNANVVNFLRRHRDSRLAEIVPPRVEFVSPVMATILAAASISDRAFGKKVEFTDQCVGYATTTGLSEALTGIGVPYGQTGAMHGHSYSKLTRLETPADVDRCNKVIADLFDGQLRSDEANLFVPSVLKVIGELHDNVPSHASGVGFSAAQVYRSSNGRRWIEFAVADCGRGMLRNVRRTVPSVESDEKAIEWCLVRGNTSAGKRDEWAQRLPDDCMFSPLPRTVPSFFHENNHLGEGLAVLTELIRLVCGQLWIWSGECEFTLDQQGKTACKNADDIRWQGVAIEIELDIDQTQAAMSKQCTDAGLEKLAGRLRL